MKRVILESPFAGNVARNIAYAKLAVKDCLLKDEAPIASHLLFTQPGILDDTKPEERKLGIAAGTEWYSAADYAAFYVDFGMSRGMTAALEIAKNFQVNVELRTLAPEIIEELNKLYPDEVSKA